MAEQSSRPARTFSDLPPEVLEMFAPYLTFRDVIVLRCVNKYFNQVFSNDIFWRHHVLYPEKYFLCDLRSDSTAPGVKNVQEEISQGKVGKWFKYYKLQRTHLQNWESGPSNNYYTIPLSPEAVRLLQDMVDEDGEHWVFFSVGDIVHIWNITGEPRALEPVNVGPHSDIHFCCNGMVLVREKDQNFHFTNIIAVYQLKKLSCALQMQYKFTFFTEPVLGEQLVATRIWNEIQFVTTRDVFIGYASYSSILNLWDLKLGVQLAEVNLCDYKFVKEFTDFYKMQYFSCRVRPLELSHVRVGEFPNIVFVLHYMRFNGVYIFNVQTMQITHLVVQMSPDVQYIYTYSDKVCVIYSDWSTEGAISHFNLSIYSLCKDSRRQIPSSQEILLPSEMMRNIENVDYPNIKLENSKLVLINKPSPGTTTIINLASEVFQQRIVNVYSYSVLGCVEPNLLVTVNRRTSAAYATDYRSVCTDAKVYNVFTGLPVSTWKPISADVCVYFKHLYSVNRLMLSTATEFRVYHL